MSAPRNEKLTARLRSASKSGHEAIRDLLKEGSTEDASRLQIAIGTIDSLLRKVDTR